MFGRRHAPTTRDDATRRDDAAPRDTRLGEAVWETHLPRRRVLAVVRNLASATRMLDVLPVFHGDPRVGVEFTVSEGSAFGRELPELLRDIDARVVPWRDAVRRGGRYHLALATSANGGLHRLRPPVVVMPHGAGHNRLVEAASGSADVASGLAAAQLLHRGRVVPARLVLAHEEQLERLRESCPPAARVAVVAGDPCFDRMTASLPLRDRFRRALGVRPGQRLVVLSSTWNGGSLFGGMPHLLARLTAELPVDGFRVAMALHPNVWDRHGAYQIEGWIAEALNAGLLLVPPRDGWRAALVAADAVVGDHGSVTYYAAALGRPTLLAAFADAEVDPASPMAALGRVLPRFRPSEGLLGQLEKLTAPVDVPDAIGMRGRAAENLRALLYGLLDLDPPANPARLRPVPPPEPRGARDVTALNVEGEVHGDRIRLDRYPAVLDDHAPDLLDDPHLVVDEGEADERLLSSADVVVRADPPEDPEAWGADVLARHRGAEIAAVTLDDGATLVVLRDGTRARAEGADASLCASAAYVLLVSGRPLAGSFTVTAGPREFRLNVTPPPPENRGVR
ncbi:translation initiation factor IF-2 [Actinomadura harenae]|uniref:Translation initiation factor IF-2 n=1 Tax=Actinomadura harenae TaxID=2483351 RepID=A0A3M2LEF3_9ACTN|nr:translation initiation factor IF-2 [Actinomadura harenae]